MALITFEDKEKLIDNPEIAEKNKVTADNINEIKRVVNENGILSYDSLPVGSVIDFEGSEIPEGYEEAEESKIVWVNPNPANSFEAQIITLNDSLSNYDCYEIIYRQSTATKRLFNSGKIPVGFGTILNYCASTLRYRPTSETITNTTISFENAINNGNQDNRECIPVCIILHKNGLFKEVVNEN